MSEQKRYTAQEMREVERDLCVHRYPVIEAARRMLRQAADAEEENAKLKARLEAVVKECEKLTHGCECVNEYLDVHFARNHADAILRAARGEGGAE